MKLQEMQTKIDRVLDDMDVTALEERIAPVDCTKKPEHADCQPVALYGVPYEPDNGGDDGNAEPDVVAVYGIPPEVG